MPNAHAISLIGNIITRLLKEDMIHAAGTLQPCAALVGHRSKQQSTL